IYGRRSEAARTAAPRHPASNGTAKGRRYRRIVAARDKAAARGKDVREGPSAVKADLQHAAIKSALEGIVVPETQLRGCARNNDRRRVEVFVAHASRIIDESSIGC